MIDDEKTIGIPSLSWVNEKRKMPENKSMARMRWELRKMVEDPNTNPKEFGRKLDEAIKSGYQLTDPMGHLPARDDPFGPNESYDYGHLIKYAIWEGRIDLVEEILNRGYNVNQKDELGATPIFAAAHESVEMADFLLQKGANINAVDRDGMTPFAYAANSGDLDRIKFLASRGAKVDTKDKNGLTPLFYAVHHGNLDTVKLLVSLGAKLDEKFGENGLTLMHIAARIEDPKMIKFLAEQGLDVDAKDEIGRTPLDYYKRTRTQYSNEETVNALKEAREMQEERVSYSGGMSRTLATAQNQGGATLHNSSERVPTSDRDAEVNLSVRTGREIA